jgi:hypothetical protein
VAGWTQVEQEAPELAAAARELFDAHRHKTLATLRRDGSPRISGQEATFALGELWLGMMPRSLKALDLRRDSRYALHGASADPDVWKADAKIAGRAEEILDPDRVAEVFVAIGAGEHAGVSHLFRADVSELVVVRLGEPPDHLVIESWHEGRGLERSERR